MKLEKDHEKAAVDYAAARQVSSTKFVSPGRRGACDRIFWGRGGKPLVVEFKRPGGHVSMHQALFTTRLSTLNYWVAVCWDFDQFKEVFDSYATSLQAA